jgi:hypothetical protein
MTEFILRREKTVISCANGKGLRDNNFNLGGLAIWDGIGQMDGNDQFETDPSKRSANRNISLFRSFHMGHYTDRP